MGERRHVKVSVWNRDVYGSFIADEKYDDDRLTEVISWLQAKLAEVPEDYQAETFLDVDSIRDYEDGHHVAVEIYYMRPETDSEVAKGAAADKDKAREDEAQERMWLRELKEKYENP